MDWELIGAFAAIGGVIVAIFGILITYLLSDDFARARVRRFFFSVSGVVIALMMLAVVTIAALLLIRSRTGCGFSDNFQGAALNANWSRVNLVNGADSYSVASGQLTLDAASGVDFFPFIGYNAPRIMQSASGNFTITTTVTLNPLANVLHPDPANPSTLDAYQGAGILITASENSFIRLERGYRGTGVDDIELLSYLNGTLLANDQHEMQATQVTLTMQRSGDTFTASWSSGGGTANTLDSIQFVGSDLDAGLVLVNNSGNAPSMTDSATFTGFTITCG